MQCMTTQRVYTGDECYTKANIANIKVLWCDTTNFSLHF